MHDAAEDRAIAAGRNGAGASTLKKLADAERKANEAWCAAYEAYSAALQRILDLPVETAQDVLAKADAFTAEALMHFAPARHRAEIVASLDPAAHLPEQEQEALRRTMTADLRRVLGAR